MEQDNISHKLKEILANSNSNFKILEDQIDVKIQIEFFELADKLYNETEEFTDIKLETERLFNQKTLIEDQKRILVKLSQNNTPEAYRIIERFISSGDLKLKKWSKLALQHCRINLESQLLDEENIIISTGLGGKETKLRYFIVFKLKGILKITKTQKKLVINEFEFSFKENNSEIEDVNFFDEYISILGLIPIDISVNNLILKALNESNSFGNFINDKYLLTNVKMLNKIEIETYFKNKGI